jgi:hypothetical protein
MKTNELKNLDYAIGVVTYVARFDTFFKPLIRQLAEVFPDKEIVCIINGHHDVSLQIEYLRNVTAFLNQFPNVHYITNEKHQPLAKCFNWLMMMSFAPRMLILNDDLSLNLLFRQDLEKCLAENQDFFIINHSWCHFLLAKKFMKEIGWFDERLAGCGQEDGDYQIRMWAKGYQVNEFKCRGVINYVAPQTNAGWAKISETVKGGDGKSAAVNADFMREKYTFDDDPYRGKLKAGMETPIFYNMSFLDERNGEGVRLRSKISPWLFVKMPIYLAYSYARKIGGKLYRTLKK